VSLESKEMRSLTIEEKVRLLAEYLKGQVFWELLHKCGYEYEDQLLTVPIELREEGVVPYGRVLLIAKGQMGLRLGRDLWGIANEYDGEKDEPEVYVGTTAPELSPINQRFETCSSAPDFETKLGELLGEADPHEVIHRLFGRFHPQPGILFHRMSAIQHNLGVLRELLGKTK